MNNKLSINQPAGYIYFKKPFHLQKSSDYQPSCQTMINLLPRRMKMPRAFASFVFFFFSHTVPQLIDKDANRYESSEENDQQDVKVPFKLEETYGVNFRANTFNGTWRTDTKILYSDSVLGDILLFDAATGTSSSLLDFSVIV